MRGARGQITVFFLIGLALLIVILIIFMIRNALLSRNAAEDGPSPYDAQLIQGYVERCIDLAAEDAFTAIGRQGGVLYTTQGGLTNPIAFTPRLDQEVFVLDSAGNPTPQRVTLPFGIIENSGYPFHPPFISQFSSQLYNPLHENPYPWPKQPETITIPITELNTWSGIIYDGAYGQVALPALCDFKGPNNPDLNNPNTPCPNYLYSLSHPVHGPNVQANMKAFIESSVRSCIDINQIGTMLGAAVQMEPPNATVTFTDKETLVDIDVPLRFVSEGNALKTSHFERRYQVRLLKLWEFAFSLLRTATKDATFRLDDPADYSGVAGYDGFVVSQERLLQISANRPQNDLFLVVIADPQSRVKQSQWFVQFLVQDRRPILEKIDDTQIPESGEIELTIKAIDPDGDDLKVKLQKDNAGSWEEYDNIQTMDLQTDKSSKYTFTITEEGKYKAFVYSDSHQELDDWQVFKVETS